MGEALLSGLLKSGRAKRDTIFVSDVSPQRREYVSKTLKVPCFRENVSVVDASDVLIIAVQPRDVKPVLDEVGEKLTLKHLLISIAAGVTTTYILKTLGKDLPLIRAMPNNPCMVGEGMTALAPTSKASEKDLMVAKEIFSSVGRVVVAEERYFDAITGLSGSGPAYIYLTIEAIADAGVRAGLPKDLATLLAAQTTLGSARMVLETKEHPAKLKDMVATPGGTTVNGVYELEKAGIRVAFMNAVEKAAQRAKELAMA